MAAPAQRLAALAVEAERGRIHEHQAEIGEQVAPAFEELLLHEQFQRPVAPAAGRDLEHAGLDAGLVDDRAHAEALQQTAAGNIVGQLFDRDTGLYAPDVGLREQELVEGDVARGREGDLLNVGSHRDVLRDERRKRKRCRAGIVVLTRAVPDFCGHERRRHF